MQLGMIGLGRMGANLLRRLTQDGHKCVVYDVNRAAAKKVAGGGVRVVVDCGTSGGVFGLERGYCLMIGGEDRVVKRLDPIFRSIAPGVKAAPRTAGKKGTPTSAEHGYLHCGPTGAGGRPRDADAETTPLRDPEYYQYDLDLSEIAEVWRRGSVIGSRLLDLTAASLLDSPDVKSYAGRVSDSGEGRWTIAAAIDEAAPAPVLSAALYARFRRKN